MTKTTPTAPPADPGLAEAAGKVAELAAESAEAADGGNRLSASVAEALVSAGFARHFVAERWGGAAGAPGAVRDLTRALATVGAGCMSAAWCGGVLTAVARMCSHLPEEGQHELWADGPDVPLAGSFAPSGTVREVSGGWRVSGTWGFASGVDHAHWTMVGGAVPGPDGVPALRHFVLPRRDYEVLDTWRNVGLCGTGSNSVLVDDVFVPAHRTFEHRSVLTGHTDPAVPRALRVPHKLINGLFFVAPGVGAVEGALAAWTRWTAGRMEIYGARSNSRPGVRMALSRAAANLDAASLLVERAATEADSAEVTRPLALRATRDYSAAVDLLLDAVNGLLRMSGARGQARSSPVQRVWRDVHCMAGHAALQPDVNADGWAKHALGEE
ncbi:two-component flavin-dependent monooxygenase [Streptomyces aurantiacus]|uniref:acyl-CoA dehydrogenase family protein n=1 Tax=Streptomyces aurantiacus TaxID=47760 RepID=UPI0027909640|nr:acyl-CoA dehydrogenase family protein [Streptomyces aurantiacus]MDQ0779121.1 two-component flavin-dependent monooxygenase [Streptomyces aurantiacus]